MVTTDADAARTVVRGAGLTAAVAGKEAQFTVQLCGSDGAPLTQVPGGQVQKYGGLSWHQVDGAGHMVPLDQPSNAYSAIDELVAAFATRRSD